MTRFSKTIRGGQNALHNFRMTVQIMRESGLAALAAGGLIAAFSLWHSVPRYHLYVWLKYQWTSILWGFSHNPAASTNFDLENGQTIVVPLATIIQSETVKGLVAGVEASAIRSLFWGVAVGLLVLVAIFSYFRFRGAAFQKRFKERGAIRLAKPAELARLIRKKRRTKAQYKIAEIPYPEDAEYRHTAATGSSGVGKTQFLRYLLKQIRAAGDRAIIYDRMGAFIGEFYDPAAGDVILNPLDARSPCWTPFDDVVEDHHFDQIAAAMIPPPQTGQKEFAEASALLMAEVMKKLKKEKKRPRNIDIIKRMVTSDMASTAAYVQGTFAQNVLPAGSPRTAASVLFQNTIALSNMRILRDAKEYFSIRKWVAKANSTGFLYLPMRADQKSLLQKLINIWFDIAINALLSGEGSQNKRLWFIVDEFPSLGKILALKEGLAEARQFGGCFVLTMQSRSQVDEIYGRDGGASIFNNAATRLSFQAVDQQMAEIEAKNIGEQIYREYDESLTYGAASIRDGVGLAEREKRELIVHPSEIQYLDPLHAFLKFPGMLPATKIKFEWEQPEEKNERFVRFVRGQGGAPGPQGAGDRPADGEGADQPDILEMIERNIREAPPPGVAIIDGPEIPNDNDAPAAEAGAGGNTPELRAGGFGIIELDQEL